MSPFEALAGSADYWKWRAERTLPERYAAAKPGDVVWYSVDELRSFVPPVRVLSSAPMAWYLDQLGDA